MTKEKFTKREWVVFTEDESEHYLTTIDCGGMMTIPVITSAIDLSFCDGEERKANAHLIAAAPEMYELLLEISVFSSFKPDNKELQLIKVDIEKLLAKARGEHE